MAIEGIEKGTHYVIHMGNSFGIESLPEVKSAIEDALTIGHKYIGLDFSDCTRIYSSGIGLIANLHKKCASQEGKVFLIGATGDVQNAIEVSKLPLIVDVLGSEEEMQKEIDLST